MIVLLEREIASFTRTISVPFGQTSCQVIHEGRGWQEMRDNLCTINGKGETSASYPRLYVVGEILIFPIG